jgi:hypothetical protein
MLINCDSQTVLVDKVTGKPASIEANGGVAVNLQDQHSEFISAKLCKTIAAVTLSSGMTLGTRTVNLVAGHGAIVGEMMNFKQAGRLTQAKVLVVAGNVITIDSPIDYAYTTAATVVRTSAEMNVNGAVTPVEFTVTPPAGIVWDITKITVHIEDNAAMDDGTFGGIVALTNGVVMQHRNGIYKHILNAKTNGELAEIARMMEYVAKPPSGTGYSANFWYAFAGQNEFGITLRLDGTTGDTIVMIIQDDLTTLSAFRVVVMGHVVLAE